MVTSLLLDNDYLCQLHRAYFATNDMDNPLPYWVRFRKGACGDRLFYEADLEPISYLNTKVPVYHVYGERFISTKVFAAIVGSFKEWGNYEEAGASFSAYHQGCMDRLASWVTANAPQDEKQTHTLEVFKQYLRTHHTIVNRVATHRVHKNVLQHVKYHFGKGQVGIHIIDEDLKFKLQRALGYQEDPDCIDPATRYFIENDFRIGAYIISNKAARSILRRYVNYNEGGNPRLLKLFYHHIQRFIGKEIPKRSRLRKFLMAVEYDPYEIKEMFLEANPGFFKDPACIEAFVCSDFLKAKVAAPWVKNVSIESVFNYTEHVEWKKESEEEKKEFAE